MRSLCLWLVLITMLAVSMAVAQEPPASSLRNPNFEDLTTVKVDAGGKISGWTLGDPPRVPAGWQLNSAYPGSLSVVTEAPREGKSALRITAAPDREAHLYQMTRGLQPGQWHRITAWIRRGSLTLMTYEYHSGLPQPRVPTIARATGGEEWQQMLGYYQAPPEGFVNLALTLVVHRGERVEVDQLQIEPITLPDIPANAPEVLIEAGNFRVVFGPDARLRRLEPRAGGENHAAADSAMPLVVASLQGSALPACALVREGDRLLVRFPNEAVRVDLKIKPGPRHVIFEVVRAEPAELTRLTLQLPVKALGTDGQAFGGTYNAQYGLCFFPTSINAHTAFRFVGTGIRQLGGGCTAARGLVGASYVLVAAPGGEFTAAIREAERATGLPSPMLGGKWARESASVEKSYFFAVDASEENMDTLIKYAKQSGFGTLILLKDNWLANHGHFDINPRNFPNGLAGLQAAVRKIHAAGLEAGVHVFGPSVSPNDPYVTPKPDDRLASVPCPPLADALTDKGRAVVFSDKPPMPPFGTESRAFPGRYVRVGDEIIRLGDASTEGPPYRYEGCVRGALGTVATAHEAGATVKGLLNLWGFFLVDPDSTLADELTTNFARVFNEADFDFVYFDASDGIFEPYLERWYYLNKMHQGYYRKFKRDVLYQTSNGTGTDLTWHLVPRSASADGHGDIKGYLDDRWPGILNMGNNFTKADIGWYYWFRDVRPDQIEYVCAKAAGVQGSISLETSREALERLAQSRQMMDMISRWERARAAKAFSEPVRAKLREVKRDFKLFSDGRRGWQLYRAEYEEPRIVDVLDGQANIWTINNPQSTPCLLGFEILRTGDLVDAKSYAAPEALLLEDFTNLDRYRLSETNQYEKFVIGEGKHIQDGAVVRSGVTLKVSSSSEGRISPACLLMEARNEGEAGGWSGIGRRFEKPLDLSGYKGLGLWLHGDGNGETLRIQLRDTAGKNADFLPVINFQGWRLLTLPFPTGSNFNWSQVEYLLFYFNNLTPKTSFSLRLDSVRALRGLGGESDKGAPLLYLNTTRVTFPAPFGVRQALTHEGVGTATLWPGGMEAGQTLNLPQLPLKLQPGDNRLRLSWTDPDTFPGGVQVIFYRLWPLEN